MENMGTVAGIAAAVTLVTAVVKAIFCTGGRVTQLVAFALSIGLAAVFMGKWGTAQEVAFSVLNGFVVAAAAIGIDQAANLERRTK
jgi:hypothetical protein